MLSYKRNNTIKLILLRLLFFVAIAVCIYLFKNGNEDYSSVLLFLLVCGSIFPVTNINLNNESLIVHQYYIMGLFRKKWHFVKGDPIEFQPFDLEVSDAGYLHTDEWWDALYAFWPTSQLSVRKYIIKQTDEIGNKTEVKTKLSGAEYQLLQQFILSNMPIQPVH